MRGSHEVVVRNARLQYKLRLNRNLTVIRGDSATGKTTLIDMIADYEANGPSSGVSIASDHPCAVLAGPRWEERLSGISGSFVFVDEGNPFVGSHDFARAVRGSDNYYVLATREDLPTLPYSVEEVYRLRNTTSKYRGVRKFYSQTRRMYTRIPTLTDPELVIVEDSNAGFDFYRALCQKSGIGCVSAAGKANMARVLGARPERRVLAIADGAAFGPEMEQVYTLARVRGYGLFLPESFEWVILRSGLVRDSEVAAVLENPSEYIDGRDYFSWERFFTDLLERTTSGTYLAYDKARLNGAYLGPAEMGAVAGQLEGTGLPVT